MRTRLSIVLLGLTLAAPAGAATRNFGINSFDRIRVEGPYKVVLSVGVAPFARATGSPSALDGLSIEVQGRTLAIRSSRYAWGGYPGENRGPVEITVGTHELNSAFLNGPGSLQIDTVKGLSFDLSVVGAGAAEIQRTDVDQLRLGLAGSGSAVLAGRAGTMTATVRGMSTLDANRLATKDATIGAEGAATVKANVTNSAKIDGSATGTITLTGNPSCTVTLVGSASVSGCRASRPSY
jgi:hypothetical protein